MTVTELVTQIRYESNTTTDTFFVDAEIYNHLYQGSMILATKAPCIQAVDTSITTVSGTRTYNFPSNLIAIKRIEYGGIKLKKYNGMREDDFVTGSNADTTSTGTPQFYEIWSKVIYLRPIPDAATVLKIFAIKQPSAITNASSTIDIPSEHHHRLINYALSRIYAKDKDTQQASYYRGLWEQDVIEVIQWAAKQKRTDDPASVQDESELPETLIGLV